MDAAEVAARQSVFCTNCGGQVNRDAIACTHCGLPPRRKNHFCFSCGVAVNEEQVMCIKCGVGLSAGRTQVVARAQEVYASPKNRVTAGVLAILVGGIGAHKFYLGSWGWGLVYLVFVWTYIPVVVAFIEGIMILVSDDQAFQEKYPVSTQAPFRW